MRKFRAPRAVIDPVVSANPVTVHVLGLCSALAVSISLKPALIMSAAVIGVLVFSNVAVSLLRHHMPHSIRLVMEVTLIATAVIIVDEVLKAFAPDVSEVLSVFVGLIITNCIVLARAESFAMHNGPWPSFLDAIGNGLGYSWVLLTVAATREILGAGTLLGYAIPGMESGLTGLGTNQFMQLSPSAFFLVALVIWGVHALQHRRMPARRAGNAGADHE
ncbi:MAG: NADH:ubiquinone reductase (Na(+)-transporting) subunit D [Xanthomonadales bacterium]|nr:NADH:ubiquinone reductase (Na(+)-transporting) subunit D [Xanthomonadales bacterium]